MNAYPTLVLLSLALGSLSGMPQTSPRALASSMGADVTLSRLSPADFFQGLHLVNESAIAAGKIAHKNGKTATVRDLGKLVADDHRNLEKELDKAAADEGVSLSSNPQNPRVQALRQKLAGNQKQLERGAPENFDQNFLRVMIEGSKGAISLVSDAKDSQGKHMRVQALADAALPVLRKHLDVAKDSLAQLGYTP